MQQLSGADSGFLQFERGNNHMHIGALTVFASLAALMLATRRLDWRSATAAPAAPAAASDAVRAPAETQASGT